MLAAYEAAIGPAPRAMAGIGLQSSAKVNEPKKSRPPKSKKKGKDRRPTSEGNMASNGKLPQAAAHRSELGESSTRSRPGYEGGVSEGRKPDSRPLSEPLQADRGQNTDNLTSAAFHKMERQALRRRKVEAAYAAAAASLFRPLSEEFDRSGYNSSGIAMEQPSSSEDNSDDEEMPAGTPSEQKEGMGMDDGESDGAPSELLARLRNGEQADAGEPGVKIEEH